MNTRHELPVTSVDIDSILALEELRQLIESCEHSGTIRAAEVAEIVEMHELAPLEHEALLRELDKRGIEIVEAAPEAAPHSAAAGDDDRRAAAVPARGRPTPAADRGRRRSSSRSGSSAATRRRSS